MLRVSKRTGVVALSLFGLLALVAGLPLRGRLEPQSVA
jgi:hypothetical protein